MTDIPADVLADIEEAEREYRAQLKPHSWTPVLVRTHYYNPPDAKVAKLPSPQHLVCEWCCEEEHHPVHHNGKAQ